MRSLTLLKLPNLIKGKVKRLRMIIQGVKMEPIVGEAQVMKGMLHYLFSTVPFADIDQHQKSKEGPGPAEETRESLGSEPAQSTW